MSVLSFSNLSYSYDKKKNVFHNINAEMELVKYMRFLGHLDVGKQHFFPYLADWTVLQKGKCSLTEKILWKEGLKITVVIMFHLFFKHIISLII